MVLVGDLISTMTPVSGRKALYDVLCGRSKLVDVHNAPGRLYKRDKEHPTSVPACRSAQTIDTKNVVLKHHDNGACDMQMKARFLSWDLDVIDTDCMLGYLLRVSSRAPWAVDHELKTSIIMFTEKVYPEAFFAEKIKRPYPLAEHSQEVRSLSLSLPRTYPMLILRHWFIALLHLVCPFHRVTEFFCVQLPCKPRFLEVSRHRCVVISPPVSLHSSSSLTAIFPI